VKGSGDTRRTAPTFLRVPDMLGGLTAILSPSLAGAFAIVVATPSRSPADLSKELTLAFASLTSSFTGTPGAASVNPAWSIEVVYPLKREGHRLFSAVLPMRFNLRSPVDHP